MRVIIGDVHGKYKEYLKIIKNVEESIQIGDFGFDYSVFSFNNIPTNHSFFTGNHDNHEIVNNCLNFLGRFGASSDFFFVSGAFSIDRHRRVQGIDWFPNEELNYQETEQCAQLYQKTKPKLMLSHDCPSFVFNYQSHTSRFLAHLFELHKPDLWIFGHHHMSMRRNILGTDFKCLNELETISV